MKKIIYFVLLIMSFTIVSCSSSQDVAKKKPLAVLDKLNIESVSLEDITLRAEISITNPYPLSIEVAKSIAETFVEDKKLAYTVSENRFYINSGKTEKASFEIKIRYDDLEKAVNSYATKEELTITVNTLFDIILPDIPLLPKRTMITYTAVKVVPALKPELSIKNFSIIIPPKEDIAKALYKAQKSPIMMVRMLGLFAGTKDEGAAQDLSSIELLFGVTFDAVITNKTKSKIEFRKLYYGLRMNDIDVAGGISTDIKNEGDTSTMKVTNVLNSKALHHALLLAIISSNKKVDLIGKADTKFPDSISKDTISFTIGKKK